MSSQSPSQKSLTRAQDIVQSIEDATAVKSKGRDVDFDSSSSHAVGERPASSRQPSRLHDLSESRSRTDNPPFVTNPGVTIPEVTFFEPRSGVPGNVVTVYIRSRQPVELNPGPKPSVIFAGHQIPSSLWPVGVNGGFYEYTVTATIPSMATVHSPTTFSLYLSINDATQNNAGPIPIGNFEYWQPMEHQAYAPLQPSSRKRRASSASALPDDQSIKRMASQTFQKTSIDRSIPPAQAYEYALTTPSQYQQFSYHIPVGAFQQQPGHHGFNYGPVYNAPYGYSAYPAAQSYQPFLGQVNMAGSFTTSQSAVDSTRRFGPVDNTRAGSSAADTPVNIRTSFLRQQASRPRLRTHASAPQFNPYSIPKATLQIRGNLNSVLENWTEEERRARRRIVEFDRHQAGSVITTNFRTVSQAEWDHTKISVNCIWWKERREAFITSVDMISLLESIMALRFTLQEKNRIRRNLEGFRPLTIGKSKPDKEPISEDVEEFFKVIMSLDEPRPRSIEKDVKVFPWSSLASAMKKVVDKYSASYASTAGTMVPAASSSRNPVDSDLPTNTSEEESSPSQSAAHPSGIASPHVSHYSSGPGTMAPLAASGIGLHDPLFSGDLESYWQTADPEDSAYQFTSGTSDAYQLPDFSAATSGPIIEPQSPLRGPGRSRIDVANRFHHDIAHFKSQHD